MEMTRLWFRAALLPSGWAERVRLVIEGADIVAVQADGAPFDNPAEMAASLVAAAAATGIGLTLLPVYYANSGFGGLAPSEGQRRFIHDLDGYARLLEASGRALAGLEDGRLGIAPHSL